MSKLFVDEIEGNTSNTIDISNFTLSSGTIGSAVTGRIKNISTGTNTASSISSNTKNIHFSNLTIPAKSLLLVQCNISTTGNNAVSDAAYVLYIRDYNDESNIQCGDGASGPYPRSGYSYMYLNMQKFYSATDQIDIVFQPYASGNYNAPTSVCNYQILEFS